MSKNTTRSSTRSVQRAWAKSGLSGWRRRWQTRFTMPPASGFGRFRLRWIRSSDVDHQPTEGYRFLHFP
ncbi:hypothetical protein EBI_26887 [Enterocytozoon bieneusi H348]|nr:hypothetical protein EBI_26887 [Enterocytozoon bieneusi H348]|eukprot:XP_002651021.1 hypothetical protein EBI_26887 [Enterocytozoon bieneusi H348]